MDRRTKHLYRVMRAYRTTAKEALRDARIVRQFEALERIGLVRIEVKPDPDPDLSWLDQDCFNDTSAARKQTQHIREKIERNGVWGTIGEFRISEDQEWEHADSCWGHAGYDNPASEFENAYVVDHMAACIEAVKEALRKRFCPNCGKRIAA